MNSSVLFAGVNADNFIRDMFPSNSSILYILVLSGALLLASLAAFVFVVLFRNRRRRRRHRRHRHHEKRVLSGQRESSP